MKKSIYILAAAALLLFSGTAEAQMGKKEYINAGWQFNATVANSFVENASGYGAYIEGGYYLTPMFAVGGFASFHTNNEYVPTKTYTFSDQSALTTDLNRSIYQVPFGATLRYRFIRTMFQPYVEAHGAGNLVLVLLTTAFAFCVVDMFDTMGTIVGCCGGNRILSDENNKPHNYDKIMICDSIATCTGAMLGTSTVTTFVESGAGVSAGGGLQAAHTRL